MPADRDPPLRRLIAAAAALGTALGMAGWLVAAVAIGLTTTPGSAHAAVIAVATEGDVRVELHDDTGPCLGTARLAIYTDGTVRTPGCWRWLPQMGVVAIAWLDGDFSQVAPAQFREPEEG